MFIDTSGSGEFLVIEDPACRNMPWALETCCVVSGNVLCGFLKVLRGFQKENVVWPPGSLRSPDSLLSSRKRLFRFCWDAICFKLILFERIG